MVTTILLRHVFIWISFFIALIHFTHAHTLRRHLQVVDVNGFVDTDGCLETMKDADANQDGFLSPSEYVTFASDLTKNQFPDFGGLPATFVQVYNIFACDGNRCTDQNNPPALEIPDAGDTGTLLYDVCRLTLNAAEPTVAPTNPPTAAPVITPTDAPTNAPTQVPVVAPTMTPTIAPTITPTVSPTMTPTISPTTIAPTRAPNPLPTTMVPVIAPTPSPTFAPVTVAPTEDAGPTNAPSASPTNLDEVVVSYDIAIRDGMNLMQDATFRQEYPLQLIQAMNFLANLASTEDIRQRRRLVVTVDTPTNIRQQEAISCPKNIEQVDDDADVCESISHEISIRVKSEELSDEFRTDLERAIMSDFQQELDSLNWVSTNGNPIILLDPLDRVVAADRSLGPAAISGITAGALLFAIIPIAYFLYHRKKKDSELKSYDANVKDDIEEMGGQSMASDLRTDAAVGHSSAMVTSATLGAAHANYGKNEIIAEPGALDDEASSNAGSSGWSSSAGISSLNTGSVDDEGATLVGLGVASAFTRNLTDTDQDEPPDRGQLDALIESGDWAAVGATAALLAAASDSQSEKSSSRADSQSADAARAAELDHLVDAGDWEGVVAAAAKFESQGSSRSGTNSQSRTNSSMESGSGSATGTGKSTMTSSVSDSPSRAMKRQEVRAEVEALVRRVVPEEIDNVDEMMNQFKGREEELIETLRTMQERAVAQKARSAGHKAAKQEARQKIKTVRGSAAAPGAVVRKVASLEIKEAASGSGGSAAAGAGMTAAANLGKRANARSALEEAIEAGDWDAVGEAAAMISDSSVTTADTAEIQRLAGTNLSLSTTESRRSNMSGIQAERAAELDQLIDSGDWSGVAHAAKNFGDSDRKLKSASAPSQEEEDALKEAEAWMKIAEQTKGKGDTGASDAAEWAIQRSLTQLKKAEKKSPKKTDEDEV